MFARDGQSKPDFERTLQERREIPVYTAVEKYKEFQQTLDKLLEHPAVLERTKHLARLLMQDSSIGDQKSGASSPEDMQSTPGRPGILVRAFHEKFVEGMRRTSSSVHPRQLLDERGIPIDRSKLVTLTDLKGAMLRTVVRDALEQLLQRPGDPDKDQLIVDKILSLAATDGLRLTERNDISAPATRAVVGAFADLISSPIFAPSASLSTVQEKLLEGLFRSPTSLGGKSRGLMNAVMDETWDAAFTARRTFIRGEHDGKLPQDLLRVRVQEAEKVVLSIVESMSRIARAVPTQEIDPETIDFSAYTFGEDRATWAERYIPAELIQGIQSFLSREDLQQVVHRAHNVKGNFNLPRALWPNRDSGGDDVLSLSSPTKKPR